MGGFYLLHNLRSFGTYLHEFSIQFCNIGMRFHSKTKLICTLYDISLGKLENTLFSVNFLLKSVVHLNHICVKEGIGMPTPSMEDHIEQIYLLINNKGYARVSDIAEALSVLPSSVTKMVQKLDKDGYLIYEKYRGLTLTAKGEKLGKRLVQRHELLEQFLRLIGVDEEQIYADVEGIEHHLSWNSINRIADLVQLIEEEPEVAQKLEKMKAQSNM